MQRNGRAEGPLRREVPMKKHRRTVIRVVLTLLSAAAVCFIFYNSCQSADDSTVRSTGLREWINSVLRSWGVGWELTEKFTRKTAHFVEFFVLGSLFSATIGAYLRRRRAVWLALPAGVLVAVCDELIQTTSAGRSGQLTDVLLDSAAVLAAVLAALLIRRLRARKRTAQTGREEEQHE